MIKILSANQEPRKGISEIEGKAVRVAAKKRGQRLSFKVGTQEALFPLFLRVPHFARRLGSRRALM